MAAIMPPLAPFGLGQEGNTGAQLNALFGIVAGVDLTAGCAEDDWVVTPVRQSSESGLIPV